MCIQHSSQTLRMHSVCCKLGSCLWSTAHHKGYNSAALLGRRKLSEGCLSLSRSSAHIHHKCSSCSCISLFCLGVLLFSHALFPATMCSFWDKNCAYLREMSRRLNSRRSYEPGSVTGLSFEWWQFPLKTAPGCVWVKQRLCESRIFRLAQGSKSLNRLS